MTRSVRCRPGPAAVEALAAAIAAAQAGDRLAAVTVAVPSTYAGLSLRRRLGARPGGLVHVQFLPMARVAELLGAPALAATGRRPLTGAVLAQAVRAVLAADPGMFAAVATHPATEQAVIRSIRELRRCTPDALDALGRGSRRAAELVRIHRRVRSRLEGGWYDEHDLAAAAAGAVRSGVDHVPLDDLGTLVTFCLRRPAPAMADLVAALGERDRATVIETDPGADRPAVDHIVGAPDPDDEVRAAVRLLAERIDRDPPVPLHRMAVLYPATEPYALLLHQQLVAAGIPHNGPGSRRLADTVAGTALLGLLALPDSDWRRDAVMGWLSSAPVLEDGRGRPAPAAAWDAVSRRAGVVGGARQWDQRVRAHIERLVAGRQPGPLEDPSGDDHGSEIETPADTPADRDVDLAERLRLFVDELVTAMAPRQEGTWRAMAEWADALVVRYLGNDVRHGRWPEPEQEAWRSVREAVGRLAALDEVGGPCDLDTFRRAVAEELDTPAGRVGTFGEGVLVAPIRAAVGTDLDTVFLLGLTEGSFPTTGHDDALLPDADRRAAGGELAVRETRMDEEEDAFVEALAAARERILLWPRSDLRRSRTRLPSRWLIDRARSIAGSEINGGDLERLAAETNWVTVVDSFEAGIRHAPAPASLGDRDLASLLAWTADGAGPGAPAAATAHYLGGELPRLRRGWDVVAARRSDDLTRFDGYVGGAAVPAFGPDDVLSPTSLEAYATCPMSYFLGRVLRLDTAEKPEDILSISALDKGTLVHAVLERYVLERLGGAPPSLPRLHAIADELFAHVEASGLTGKPLLWDYERRLIRRELTSYYALDGLTPRAAELAFGMEDEDPVQVELDDGRVIAFRGKADRVDDDGDGGLVVTDYKTGRGRGYEQIAGDPVDRGRRLQLPLYGLAARARFGADRPVLSRYWLVSEIAGYRTHPVAITDDVLARFRQVVGTIVDGITAGAFPARPGEPAWQGGWENCRFCAFTSLCQEERDVHWDRKKSVLVLQPYVTMAEGKADGDTGE